MKHLRIWTLAVLLAVALPGAAHAAPVTVNLRIEGSNATLYEGPITSTTRQPAMRAELVAAIKRLRRAGRVYTRLVTDGFLTTVW